MISFRIYVLLTMLILKSLLVNEGSFILVVIEFFPHENSRQKLRLNILVSMISSRMNGQVTSFLIVSTSFRTHILVIKLRLKILVVNDFFPREDSIKWLSKTFLFCMNNCHLMSTSCSELVLWILQQIFFWVHIIRVRLNCFFFI